MHTSSHILAALTVITASSLAMGAIATTASAPTLAPAPAQKETPIPVKNAECYKENATLTVSFNAHETTAQAAIAYPETKIKEVETMLTQATPDYTLQSMNYSVSKNRNGRHSGNSNSSAQWQINGSFNMQFTSIDSAQKALIAMDNDDFTPRLNVNKNKSHRCN